MKFLELNRVPRFGSAALALFLVVSTQKALAAATAESNLSKTFTVHPGGQLIMDVDRGGIEIRTGDTAEVKVEVERKITRGKVGKADEIFAAHDVTFDQDGDRVEVHAKFKRGLLESFNRSGQNLQV